MLLRRLLLACLLALGARSACVIRRVVIYNTCAPLNQIMNLNEIQVWSNGVNVARGKPAFSSSNYGPMYLPSFIVDGVTINPTSTSGFYSTAGTDVGPGAWVMVDLQGNFSVSNITVWNRSDCCQTRALGATMVALDAFNTTVAQWVLSGVILSENFTLSDSCTTCQPVRGVLVKNTPGTQFQNFQQVQASY